MFASIGRKELVGVLESENWIQEKMKFQDGEMENINFVFHSDIFFLPWSTSRDLCRFLGGFLNCKGWKYDRNAAWRHSEMKILRFFLSKWETCESCGFIF